jgi:hypothetical protein
MNLLMQLPGWQQATELEEKLKMRAANSTLAPNHSTLAKLGQSSPFFLNNLPEFPLVAGNTDGMMGHTPAEWKVICLGGASVEEHTAKCGDGRGGASVEEHAVKCLGGASVEEHGNKVRAGKIPEADAKIAELRAAGWKVVESVAVPNGRRPYEKVTSPKELCELV